MSVLRSKLRQHTISQNHFICKKLKQTTRNAQKSSTAGEKIHVDLVETQTRVTSTTQTRYNTDYSGREITWAVFITFTRVDTSFVNTRIHVFRENTVHISLTRLLAHWMTHA